MDDRNSFPSFSLPTSSLRHAKSPTLARGLSIIPSTNMYPALSLSVSVSAREFSLQTTTHSQTSAQPKLKSSELKGVHLF